MKRYLALIANILLILIGLLGLKTPYVYDAAISIGIGGFLDTALLQPLFIGLTIVAIYGQFVKVKVTLLFWPIIVEFVAGIVGFIFIFPVQNLIVGYIALAVILFLLVWPLINKQIQKKKVVKIKV